MSGMIYTVDEFTKFVNGGLPVLDELNSYLVEILASIEEELASSIVKHFGQTENWRVRKNPNFMSQYSAKDRIFLDINQNLNKITNLNWKTIAAVLSELIQASTSEQLPSIADTLVSSVLEKSVAQSLFAEYYIKTINALEVADLRGLIAPKMAGLIKQFFDLLTTEDDVDNSLTQMVGLNICQFKAIGNFFAYLYAEGMIEKNELMASLPRFIRDIADTLEWEPINKVMVESKIHLLTGFLESAVKVIYNTTDKDTQQDLDCQLSILTNHGTLPARLKYQLLDISDKIQVIKKAKASVRNAVVRPNISYANIAGATGTKSSTIGPSIDIRRGNKRS